MGFTKLTQTDSRHTDMGFTKLIQTDSRHKLSPRATLTVSGSLARVVHLNNGRTEERLGSLNFRLFTITLRKRI